MTLSPWIIYLWGISDRISTVFYTLAIILLVTCFISAWVVAIARSGHYPDMSEETAKIVWKHVKRMAFITPVLFLLGVLTPSSKTIAVMVVAPAIINSEPIQKDLPELYKAAKDALMVTLENQK